MKKTILTFLSFVVMLGCANIPHASKSELLDIITKEVSKPDLEKSKTWWLVISHNDKGKPIACWIIKDDSLSFVQWSTSIVFVNPDDGQKMILKNNYSFTIIKMGEWHHPDFSPESLGLKKVENNS